MFSRLSSLHFSEEVNDSISAQRHWVSKTILPALLRPDFNITKCGKAMCTLTEKFLKYTLGMGTMKLIHVPSNYFLRPHSRNKEPRGLFSKEPL